jgi:hypothetical protein
MPLSARDRRTLIYGGIALGVIVGAYLIYTLFLSGGSNQALPTFSPITHPPVSATPSRSSQQPPPPAAELRDPFSVPPGLGPSATPSGATGSTGSGGGTSSGPPPTVPGNGSSIVIGGHTVVLISVYTHNGVSYAQVEVDGVVYTPSVGAHFHNGEFLLRSTSGDCASFLFGDQAFGLCTNPQK